MKYSKMFQENYLLRDLSKYKQNLQVIQNEKDEFFIVSYKQIVAKIDMLNQRIVKLKDYSGETKKHIDYIAEFHCLFQ